MQSFADNRVRTEPEPPRVSTRLAPIDFLNITATTSGTAQTLYTAPTKSYAVIGRLSVANVTGTNATLTLHCVAPAGSLTVSNAMMVGVTILANATADLTQYVGGFLRQGYALKVFSGTNGALTLNGWVTETE